MDTAPIVSVITPFLNAQRFITETIESVLAQSFLHWELLLVDDGSNDGSSEIARRAAAANPGRVRYLEHPGHANRGKSSSRNLGISRSAGRYIAFLDADDVFLPDKLRHQVELLESMPEVAMVYGATEYWVSWDRDASARRQDWIGKLGVRANRIYQPPELLARILGDPGAAPCICALLARREAALAVGAFEESIQDLYEDQVFIAKMLLHGPVFVEEGFWERYRQHLESSSVQAQRAGRYHPTAANEARRIFLEWVAGYVQELGVHDHGLSRALAGAQRPYRGSWWSRLMGR